MPINVPLDVVNSILNNLYTDTQALLQCCLVSRNFLIPSRKTLFMSLSIERPTYDRDERIKVLGNFLIANMKCFTYIQELHILIESGTVNDAKLLTLFASETVPNLRIFNIKLDLTVDDPSSPLPRTITKAISKLGRSPLLSHLDITSYGSCFCAFPLNLIESFPSTLTHLHLTAGRDSDFSHESRVHPDTSACPDRSDEQWSLQVLNITGSCAQRLSTFLQRPYGINNVKHLSVAVDPSSMGWLWQILYLVRENIEQLGWNGPQFLSGEHFASPLDLHRFTCLRSLVFDAALDEDLLQAVMMILAENSLPETLERFILVLYWIWEAEESVSICQNLDRKLFSVFDSRPKLPAINIHMETEYEQRSDLPMGFAASTWFPQLHVLGNLSLIWEEWDSAAASWRNSSDVR